MSVLYLERQLRLRLAWLRGSLSLPLLAAVVTGMLCDPVLAFVKAFRLRGSVDSLKRSALSKFDATLMLKAKKALWDSACSEALLAAGLPFLTRRGSEKRSQAAADLDDILSAFDKLDEGENIPDIFCEAVDLVKLPPIVVDALTELVQHNSSALEKIECKLDSLSLSVSSFSAELVSRNHAVPPDPVSVRPQLSSAPGGSSDGSIPPRPMKNGPRAPFKTPAERQENLILFGLEESRSLPDTMDSVKRMLEFITGRPTPVKDLYRIGKFKKPDADQVLSTPSRPRPILLKLASPWDRRLVLANRFCLKHFTVQGLFLREDLSPEDRQQRRG